MTGRAPFRGYPASVKPGSRRKEIDKKDLEYVFYQSARLSKEGG